MRRNWRSGSGRTCGRANGSWRVDETYVRVEGRWMHPYRAVDSRGATID